MPSDSVWFPRCWSGMLWNGVLGIPEVAPILSWNKSSITPQRPVLPNCPVSLRLLYHGVACSGWQAITLLVTWSVAGSIPYCISTFWWLGSWLCIGGLSQYPALYLYRTQPVVYLSSVASHNSAQIAGAEVNLVSFTYQCRFSLPYSCSDLPKETVLPHSLHWRERMDCPAALRCRHVGTKAKSHKKIVLTWTKRLVQRATSGNPSLQ